MLRCRLSYAKVMQIECRTTSLLDCYAEMQLILCKDNANRVHGKVQSGFLSPLPVKVLYIIKWKMNCGKSCHSSSCEPVATGRRSKKNAHGLKGCTRSLWPRIFFWPLLFRFIGILNGFASVTACGCWGSVRRMICCCLAYIYIVLRKASATHLQDSFDSFD